MRKSNVILKNKTILITGAAGFIESNLVLELLKTQSPVNIIGIDNLNDYYDVSIKKWRLKQIEKMAEEHRESIWTFIKGNIADSQAIKDIFENYKPSIVVNLAAQAGVRYSITNPKMSWSLWRDSSFMLLLNIIKFLIPFSEVTKPCS